MSKSYDKLHSVKISEQNMRRLRKKQKELPAKCSIPSMVNYCIEAWLRRLENWPLDAGKQK